MPTTKFNQPKQRISPLSNRTRTKQKKFGTKPVLLHSGKNNIDQYRKEVITGNGSSGERS